MNSSESYQISLSNLGQIYSKIMQNVTVLSILNDWVCESDTLFNLEGKEKVMNVVDLVTEITRDIEKLLPSI